MSVLEAEAAIRYTRWARRIHTHKFYRSAGADSPSGGALGATTCPRTASSETVATNCTGAIRPVEARTGERAGRITYWFASGAHPLHALLPLLTAVEAFATVVLVSIKVYAPVVAAALAFRAAANLVVSPPDAVSSSSTGSSLLSSLPRTPAIVGPGCTWEEGTRQLLRRAPPIHLEAFPLGRVPLASPLASWSKETLSCSSLSDALV